MKTKRNYGMIAFAFLFAILLSVSFISATTTLVLPAQDATITDPNIALNVTTTDNLDPGNLLLNISFYAQSTSTANSSWVLIGQNLNYNSTTSNNSQILVNLTDVIEDASDYIFNVTVSNSSVVIGTDTSTGVIVDNSAPTAPTLSPASNTVVSTSTTQTFTGTVTGTDTTSCTYTIARGGASSGNDFFSGTATHTGNSCTFSKAFTTSSDNGQWHYTITASDGLNTSSSVTNIYQVAIPANNGGGAGEDGGAGTSSEDSNSIWWIVGIVIAVLILGMIINKRK